MKRKIIEITWFDAQTSMDTYTKEELVGMKPLLTHSVGYLVLDRKDSIVISCMDFADGLFKHHQCIPRGMIKRVKVIRKGEL